jgi:hypothetical protein
MDWERACQVFQQVEEARFEDPHGLRAELIHRAVRYARLRADWQISASETRFGMDAERIAAHNALIDACNVLSRQMKRQGLDISWRDQLGEDRKEVGDFACYLHCILGLMAR